MGTHGPLAQTPWLGPGAPGPAPEPLDWAWSPGPGPPGLAGTPSPGPWSSLCRVTAIVTAGVCWGLHPRLGLYLDGGWVYGGRGLGG